MGKRLNYIFLICFILIFLTSSAYAVNESNINQTIKSDSISYQVTNDEDIQSVLDNAKDGDTIELKSKEYKNVSLVVDKKLNIISNVNSKVYASSDTKLGMNKTFAFYFTSNSGGSILSGITIIAGSNDYGIIVDSSDNTVIKNNVITGGVNSVLITNSNNVSLIENNILRAADNGLQLQDSSYTTVYNNTISYNGRSGIETSNIFNSDISYNRIHHNSFNGISMYNQSGYNSIKHNDVYENTNGIYIDSQSSGDVVNANSFTSNRRDPNCELGGYESGNGLLFGSDFKTSKEGSSDRLQVKYNVLAHNEQYQAKNNPDLPVFKLGDNWFDSTDDSNTFVCPMLLAGIMKLNTISVKNGIGLQMYDTQGNPVPEFGTFDTTVNIDGNQYTAKFINGKAIVDANLDSNKEYDLEVMVGGQPVKYTYKPASGDEDTGDSSSTDGETGKSGTSQYTSLNSLNAAGSSNQGGGNGSSVSTHLSQNDGNSEKYGLNNSDIYSQDSSDNGQNAISNGDEDAGQSVSGESSQEGKAYEIIPPSKISNQITDTSGVVVLVIVSLMAMLIFGYRNKSEEEY